MADAVVGALRVLLGLDSAAFSSGLKESASQLDKFGAQFSSFAKKLAIGAAATKFVYDIKGMIDAADQLGKSSQKFGVPVESLSALKYAADLADVSFESLSKGLGKLSKAMFEGAVNPGGDVAKVFKAIGVSVTDANGQVRSTEDTFKDIAAKFANMEDGAAKTALAIKIFGKSGADLIPLLNQGRTGIQAMTEEAKKLGIIISTETAAKAEQFNDTLKKINASADATKLAFARDLLPVLQRLADEWLRMVAEGDKSQGMFKNVADTVETDLRDFKALVTVIGFVGEAFKGLWEIVSSGLDLQKKFAAAKGLTEIPEKLRLALAGVNAEFANMGKAGGFDALENLPSLMDKVAQGTTKVKTELLASKSALDSFIESQAKAIAARQAEAAAIGQGLGVQERLKIYFEAEAIAREKNITLTDTQKMKLNELAAAAEKAAIDIAAAQLKQDALSPWDQYLQKLRDINTVLQQHPELANQAAQASMKAAATMAESYGTAMAGAMGNFAPAQMQCRQIRRERSQPIRFSWLSPEALRPAI